MRTTVDIDDDVLRTAKVRAAEHGESLKTLIERAVRREVGEPRSPGQRVRLPLVGTAGGPEVDVSGADIADLEADDDIRRYGAAGLPDQ
jgi:plasmid stability protein